MKEPEKPAEAEAAEGEEATAEGKDAAPATDGTEDKKEQRGEEKKAPEEKK